MRRGVRLGAVFVAALAWAVALTTLADWSGVLAPPATVGAADPVNDDPCGLRQFLPVGTDARCELVLERDGGDPLTVELAQTWDSTAPAVLVQHLRTWEKGAKEPLEDLQTRSAATSLPSRILRLAVIPVSGGQQLIYVMGNCGATGCGANDVVVTSWQGRTESTLLRRRVGTLAEIELTDGRLTVYDGTGRGAGKQRSDRMQRTFVWVGGVYAEIAHEAVPTAPPP